MPQECFEQISRMEYSKLEASVGKVLAGVARPEIAKQGTCPAILQFEDANQILTIEEQKAFLSAVIQNRFRGDNMHSYDAAIGLVVNRLVKQIMQNSGLEFPEDEDKRYSSIGKPCGTLKEGEGHA